MKRRRGNEKTSRDYLKEDETLLFLPRGFPLDLFLSSRAKIKSLLLFQNTRVNGVES